MRSWVYFLLAIVFLVDSTFCAPEYAALEGVTLPEKRSIEKRSPIGTTVDPVTALLGSLGSVGATTVKSTAETVESVIGGLEKNLGGLLS